LNGILKGFSLALLSLLSCLSFAQGAWDFLVPNSNHPHLTRGKRTFQTNYIIYRGPWTHPSLDGPFAETPEFGPSQSVVQGYHPADILAAYSIPANSGSESIAVIDAYDLPTNLNDFNVFSTQFNLPTETSTNPTASTNKVLQVVYSAGTKPTSNTDWNGEISLDIEWAHALAPNAKIYLVECPTDSVSDLLAGAQFAAITLPNLRVVSMSFGSNEFANESEYDSIFTQTNVTFLAAAGDAANIPTYPATSPNVIAVGGTTLNVFGGKVTSEVYWYTDVNDAGSSGPSKVEPRPTYQNAVASIVGNFKGNPDIAADANPSTGCAVYVSSPVAGQNNQTISGWLVFGGTSLACPIEAGIIDDRGSFAQTSFDALTNLYSLSGTSAFRDIVSGSSGEYSAKVGYDFVTGLGAPLSLYVSHGLTLSSPALVNGVAIEGAPSSMILKDDHMYLVRSTPVSGDQVAGVGGTFTGSIAGSSAKAATVAVAGLSTAKTTQLLALNLTTGDYDVLGTLSLGTTLSTATVSISNIGTYLSSSGKITFRIMASDVGTVTQVRLGVDQVAMTVATSL
jgi:kumamolisin